VDEGYTFTFQAGYAGTNWGLAVAYAYSDYAGSITPFAIASAPGYGNNVGLSGYWQPSESGLVPSISAGVGFGDDNIVEDSYSWMVGLQWTDVFVKGNALGMALGTSSNQTGGSIILDNGDDNLAYELWYKFQVTDNISVTPAFFWIGNEGDDTFGGVLKTTFKF
jgi:hypothetical protein